MLKGNDLINKPIFADDTGKKIENEVVDLLIDYYSDRLVGFLVSNTDNSSNPYILPFNQFKGVTSNVIIALSEKAIVTNQQEKKFQQILEQNNVFRNTKLTTTEGQELGTIVDIYFDEKTGVIKGYEVVGKNFFESYSNRLFIPITQVLKVGKKSTFVWLKSTDEAVTAIDSCFPTLQKTEKQCQETHSLLEQIKVKVSKTQDEDQTGEKEHIKSVLGHPVTKAILDKQGKVILNIGDLITYEALKKVKQADVLEILVSAIYKKKFEYLELPISEFS